MTGNSGSLLVILGMAGACFSGECGTSESGGRGGIIDCGFLYGVVFGAGIHGDRLQFGSVSFFRTGVRRF